MSTQSHRAVWALGIVAALAGAAALARPVSRWFETPPSIPAVGRLIHEGKYDDAERALVWFLASNPGHREGNLLMAQVLIDRPNPRPPDALDHLNRVRSRDPQSRAVVDVMRGKALYQLSRFSESEAAWNEALALDPNVAEAGWLLIQQYYVQGRDEEARRLALKLSPVETDAVDRVRYLLELSREDVERLSPAGVIQWLQPAVKANPNDRASVLALGKALVKEGRLDEGYALLKKALADHPERLDGWDAWLGALADAGEVDRLAGELAKVPAALAGEPRLGVYRGRVAQERRDYPEAVRAYAEALKVRPTDPKLLYRLGRSLRLAGRVNEAKAFEQREAALNDALKELGDLYKELTAEKAAGTPAPDSVLFQRFASLRERLGKSDEALAWHRLVLRDDPQNPVSLAEVARLSRSAGG